MTERKLKVYSRFKRVNKSLIEIPEIRLTGKWLLELGFKPGLEIKVKTKNGRLTIIFN